MGKRRTLQDADTDSDTDSDSDPDPASAQYEAWLFLVSSPDHTLSRRERSGARSRNSWTGRKIKYHVDSMNSIYYVVKSLRLTTGVSATNLVFN